MAVNKDINSILNNNDNGLIKLNNKLFELYTNRTQLEIQKELQRSLIVSSSDQIRERINYYANVQNEVRAKKLSFAEDVIRKAIEDYGGIIDENTGNDLIPAIIAAYNGNKAEARRIAEEVMANPGEGSITASEFLDALDILLCIEVPIKTFLIGLVKLLICKVNLFIKLVLDKFRKTPQIKMGFQPLKMQR